MRAQSIFDNQDNSGGVPALKKKDFSELVIGVVCIALGIAVYIAANSLQKVKLGIGPGGFPHFIAVVLMLLGAVQTVITLASGVNAPKSPPRRFGSPSAQPRCAPACWKACAWRTGG